MEKPQPRRLLTSEEKKMIYDIIYKKMNPDDEWPEQIIQDRYKGDENAYLWDMIDWHSIKLDG
ncbi:MAG TPA: hypothetical protein VJB92_02835 [Candidatus Paceibacterota bacterium]